MTPDAIVAARERLTEALRQLGYGSATSALPRSPTATSTTPSR